MNLRFLQLIFAVIISTSIFSQVTNVSLVATKDAYTSSASISSNYGTDVALYAGLYPNKVPVGQPATYHVRRSAIECDLSSIPSNAIITSAVLRIYATAAKVNSPVFKLSRNTESWIETGTGDIDWSTHPDFNLSDAVTFNGTSSAGAIGLDVKTHVQKMVAGVYSNYGWTLSVDSEGTGSERSQNFSSNNHATSGQRPTLEISYYLPMSVFGAIINHESSSGANDGSISPTLVKGPEGTLTYQWFNSAGSMAGKTALNLADVPYGWYGLQVTSSISGSLPFYYAFLVGLNCKTVPIEFNPDSKFIDDAMLYDKLTMPPSIESQTNYSTGSSYFEASVESLSARRRSLLKFKVWIDHLLTINEAELFLNGNAHLNSGISNSSKLFEVLSYWEESIVTHTSIPLFDVASFIDLPNTTSSGADRLLNIENFVNEWKTNNSSNNGWIMETNNNGFGVYRQQYFPSENGTAGNRPKISFELSVSNPVAPNYCNQIFAKLERKLTGVKYEPYLSHLYFYYDEEYETPNYELSYKVFTVSDQINPIMDPTDQSLSQIEYGDNRYTLDVSSLAVGTYILEVTNNKKEKFFLRFQKVD